MLAFDEGAYVKLLGRHDTFSAIVEPRRDTALIGAMVIRGLELLVDSRPSASCPAIRGVRSTRSSETERRPAGAL
jgi:hypothetical protein